MRQHAQPDIPGARSLLTRPNSCGLLLSDAAARMTKRRQGRTAVGRKEGAVVRVCWYTLPGHPYLIAMPALLIYNLEVIADTAARGCRVVVLSKGYLEVAQLQNLPVCPQPMDNHPQIVSAAPSGEHRC